MATSYGWTRALPGVRTQGKMAGKVSDRDQDGGSRPRLVPILLALYLTPALLLVLLVGGLGLLIVAAARALPISRHQADGWLRDPIESDSTST